MQEAAIRNAASQYKKASDAVISGRDAECAAFRLINHELETCTEGHSRTRAIGRNHNLWSLLVKDLSLADNRLPEGVKQQLVALGLWSMRYSTLALLRNLSVDPLVAVNCNVLDGLVAQATGQTNDQRPASPFSA